MFWQWSYLSISSKFYSSLKQYNADLAVFIDELNVVFCLGVGGRTLQHTVCVEPLYINSYDILWDIT